MCHFRKSAIILNTMTYICYFLVEGVLEYTFMVKNNPHIFADLGIG